MQNCSFMRIVHAREHPDYVGVKVDGTDEVQSGIRQRAVDSYNSATDGVPVSLELLDQSIDRLRILTSPFIITLRRLVVRGRLRRFRHRSSGHPGRRTGKPTDWSTGACRISFQLTSEWSSQRQSVDSHSRGAGRGQTGGAGVPGLPC